jgi:hypothetical protein
MLTLANEYNIEVINETAKGRYERRKTSEKEVSRKRLPLLLCRHNGVLVGEDDAVLLEAVALNCRSRADRWTRPWTNSRSACCERKGKKRERERGKWKKKQKKKQWNIQETLGGSCDLDDHLPSRILAIARGLPASSAFSDLSK